MNTYTDKTKDKDSIANQHSFTNGQSKNNNSLTFEDNRPEALVQRNLQEKADNSLQVKTAAQLQAKANTFSGTRSTNTLQFKKDETAGKTAVKQKKAKAPTVEENQKTQIKVSASHPTALMVNIYHEPYKVEFTDSLPEVIKKGLKNHAGTLLSGEERHPGTFPEYSTSSFAIEGKAFGYEAKKLKKYKGTTVFEFTRLKNNDEGLPVFLVKELGKDDAPKVSDDEKSKNKKYFNTYFKLDSSWSDTEEIDILYNTVAKIPNGLLSQISGVTFKRASVNADDSSTAGLHQLDVSGQSTITLFDLAFKDRTFVRYGDEDAGFSTPLQFTIIHEIGHAMDSRKIKKSLLNKDAASKKSAMDSADLKKESEAMGRFEGNYEAYKKALNQAVASKKMYLDSDKAASKARSESGYGYDEKVSSYISWVEKDTKTEFREALANDGGLEISDYGETRMNECFAEFFAYYVLDGKRLKRLRPAVYQYFTSTFPM